MAEPGVKRRSERRVHALNHFTSRALVHLRGGAGLSVVTRARSAFSVTEVTVSSLLGWWRSGPPLECRLPEGQWHVVGTQRIC